MGEIAMRKVVAFEWMSLDGVVQAPAYGSNGFKHGGWHVRYFDERSMKWVITGLAHVLKGDLAAAVALLSCPATRHRPARSWRPTLDRMASRSGRALPWTSHGRTANNSFKPTPLLGAALFRR
jgi:hypothetical protein